MDKKLVSMLSLCMKAGKLRYGAVQSEGAIKSKEAKVVIVATDVGATTKKKFGNKTTFYEVPYVEIGTKDELSMAIGKTDVAVLSVCDDNFGMKIIELCKLDNDSDM